MTNAMIIGVLLGVGCGLAVVYLAHLPWLPEWATRLRHARGDHRWCPSKLIEWEVYPVEHDDDGNPTRYEAEGMPEGGDDCLWLHGPSAGAVLDEAMRHWPEHQHKVLESHGQPYHLCAEGGS